MRGLRAGWPRDAACSGAILVAVSARPTADSPRILVSYSHDSDAHALRVAKLVERLRGDGFELAFDQDHDDEPSQGWPAWCDDQVEWADYVVAVCTATYRRRFERSEALGIGRGATWEGGRLRDTLYDAGGRNYCIAPILLPGAGVEAVPDRIRRTRRYAVEHDYDALVAMLRDRERLAALSSSVPMELPTQVDELLFDGIETLAREPMPSQLLNARYGVVPFAREARRRELDLLATWCDGPGVGVRLFHGPGGTGKTRLFREWCIDRRRDNWVAGFLPADTSKADLESVLDDPRPTLLVVDYAESKPVESLLDTALAQRRAGRDNPLRIALISRTCGDWWVALSSSSPDREGLLREHLPVRLSVLSADVDVRRRMFERAHEAFAFIRGVDGPVPDVDLGDERFEQILYVHAAALDIIERARRGEDAPKVRSARALLGSVIDHEQRLWMNRWTFPEQRRAEAERRFRRAAQRAVAALTLRGGAPDATTTRTLLDRANAPRSVDDGTPHETFEMLLRDLYPGRAAHGGAAAEREAGYLAPLEPDLLGETLVAMVLDAEPEDYATLAFTGASPVAWEVGFTVLGRIMQSGQETAEAVVGQLLCEGFEQRAVPAVRAALAVSSREVFSRMATLVTSRLVAHCPGALASRIEAALPKTTLSLGELCAWSYQQQLGDATTSVERAGLLNNLGRVHNELGRAQQALASTTEAVAMFRELVRERRDVFLSHLAASLTNLGNSHAAQGAWEEALQVTKEAVDAYRQLARARPDAFRAEFAASLANLGIRYSAVGRREEALASTVEAVAIRRQLARQRPDAFLGDLAASLNNLGMMRGRVGHREEALASTAEAVAIRRQLARQWPDAFLPGLAASLVNLGNRYSKLGRREQALTPTMQAVTIYRELVRERREAFLPDLAVSVTNLGMIQRDLGRREEALASTAQAVAHFRELGGQQPRAFRAQLAASIDNLGIMLSEVNRLDEALASTVEAVAICRELAQQQPDASRPPLAGSLTNLGIRYRAVGRREEALSATMEAVAIRRQLVRERPHVFLPDLAASLASLGSSYSELGRTEEALAPAREAVAMYQELARARSDVFRPHVAGSLTNLGIRYRDLGRLEDALASIDEAVAIRRELARDRPEVFMPDLAMSLGARARTLSTAGLHEQALDAFAEGLRTILPLSRTQPDACGPLAAQLGQGVLQACQAGDLQVPEDLEQRLLGTSGGS